MYFLFWNWTTDSQYISTHWIKRSDTRDIKFDATILKPDYEKWIKAACEKKIKRTLKQRTGFSFSSF
jgi:hypothetical protein